jgi:subtilisin-like proprotein convertase family protein
MVLEISNPTVNAGAFQDIITAGGSFVTAGYNGTISTAFMNPLGGRMAWTGTSAGGYLTTEVNLPATASGQNITLKWRMGSDNSVAATGVWVDSILVNSCTFTPASPCSPTSTTGSNTTPVPILDPVGGVQQVAVSTINISGAGTYLTSLRAGTFITHTFAADLDMTLTSPAGTIVTMSSDNGGVNDNVFNGTIWDDKANPFGNVPYVNNNGLVTDHLYANLALASPLVPEEPFDAFRGENPNGTWTLRIADDLGGDTGSLNSWNLDVRSLPTAPTINTPASFNNMTPAPIPDAGSVTSTVLVSGMTGTIEDVKTLLNITHTDNSDLDITVRSPSGRVVTLTTDNGLATDNGFAGTTFDTKVDPANQVPFAATTFAASNMVTDTVFVNLVTRTPLTPEESLGAFRGEQPNGTWTLTVSDDLATDTGMLNSWGLTITTNTCPGPTASAASVSGRVTTPEGNGLRNARVTITDPSGVTRTAVTGTFGYYRFDNVTVGETYVIGVTSNRYMFTSRVIQVFDDLADIDFTPQE